MNDMNDNNIDHENLIMDHAQEIDNLRAELERVKGIAGRRLDRIAQLQHQVAVLEDKLEDTRSDLFYAEAAERLSNQNAVGRAERPAQDLADARKRILELEREVEISTKLADNRLERIFNLLGAIDSPNPVIAKDNELASSADELLEMRGDYGAADPRL
jgi:phage shock protein A